MTPTPDTTGFIEAQRNLIWSMGEDVSFISISEKVWPPGVEIDPQTGEPYDPTVEPESGGEEIELLSKVGVFYRPITGMNDDVVEGPSGVRRDESPAFIVLTEDYEAVKDSTTAVYNGIRYRITEFTPDSFVNVLYRWICFTEPT